MYTRGIQQTILLFLLLSTLAGCVDIRRVLTQLFSGSYGPPDHIPQLKPEFTGADETRLRISITLTPVAWGFDQPTDVQFDPSNPTTMIVLEKEGTMKWRNLASADSGIVMRFDVATVSEQGLLGLAFHPAYPDTPTFYVNLTPTSGNLSRVVEVRLEKPASIQKPVGAKTRIVMEVEQPYQNHNAGQLAFGPDGYLYVGWGDGGWLGDPHNHGQTMSSLLGKMLRINPTPTATAPYSIPPDNPFVNAPAIRPEIWASGLRNPWRYCFDTRGRLIVADVGQNAWEELDIIEKGKNYGWRCREGLAPYDESTGCRGDFANPFYVYGREEGQSITGGVEYLANDIPELKGFYIFGDFISGRIWAMKLPDKPDTLVQPQNVYALGRWPLQIPTFARDASGKVYVADFGLGVVYRIDKSQHPEGP